MSATSVQRLGYQTAKVWQARITESMSRLDHGILAPTSAF